VDIVLLHDPDDHYYDAVNKAYPALAELRSQGVVKAIGVGMNQWQMLDNFLSDTDPDLFLLAGRYTLLEQAALNLLNRCQTREVAVILGGVFNSGILATGAVKGAKYNYQDAPSDIIQRVKQIEKICSEYNIPLSAVAVQFALAHPAVSSIALGMESAAQVDSNIASLMAHIPETCWLDLRAEGVIDREAPTPLQFSHNTNL
jgi:D-threo-aldose 1-dehydrogenase